MRNLWNHEFSLSADLAQRFLGNVAKRDYSLLKGILEK